jgi:putative copper export protein
VALSLVTAWALVLLHRPALAAVFAMLILVASGATGHPAAITPSVSIPLKIVHLVAVALWLGGLLVLVLSRSEGEPYQAAARRVSQTALIAVAAIAVTGLAEAYLFLPRVADLVQSPYGLMVLGKAAGLGVLVAFGARHRFTLMPRLISGGASGPMRRSVTAESGVMAVVLLLAAFLAYIPPPSGMDPLPGTVTDQHGGHDMTEDH